LLFERLAIDADSFEDLCACGLDGSSDLRTSSRLPARFFDFKDGLVDGLEIHLLSGRLSLGAEAESAGGNNAGLQEHVGGRVFSVPDNNEIAAVSREWLEAGWCSLF